MSETYNGWNFLDRIWEGAQNIGGKLLDAVNTRNLTEAQIASARAQELQAVAFSNSAPFLGTDYTKLAIAGAGLFFAYKFLK